MRMHECVYFLYSGCRNIIIVGQIMFHDVQADGQRVVFECPRKNAVNARGNRRVQ